MPSEPGLPFDAGDTDGTPGDAPADAEPADRPSVDRVFEALAHRRRRYLLYHLLRRGGTIAVDELAGLVARTETPATDAVSPDETVRDRTAAALHHSHLPKLAATNLVSYDRANAAVSPGPHADLARPYLELTADEELR